MINWISPFNYDFAIAAIPIQIVLLVFYGFRRNLRIRQSNRFWIIMITNLIMTSADIISCEMNEIWTEFPLWAMYGINHAYFLGFILRGWALFAYTAESTHIYRNHGKLFRTITDLPATIAIILILSTPWTSAIYTIAEDGYHNCALYKTIYFSTYFYITVSILIIIRYWRPLAKRMRAGLLSYNLLLLFGIVIRKQFYHMLVTSYFSILSIIIIFLTSENPDLYREKKTALLNKNAFNIIRQDYWERKKPFHVIVISLQNYEASKTIYGVEQVHEGIEIISDWLKKNYGREFIFYTGSGNFLLLTQKVTSTTMADLVESWDKIGHELQRDNGGMIPLKASFMLLPYFVIREDISLVDDLIRYSVINAYDENQKGNFVYTDDLVQGLKKQKSIEKAIKNGIKEKHFEAYYQPIFSTKLDRVVGAEALARLIDPDIGFISPLDFISVAEKNGDIMEIGRQIFDKVCLFLEKNDPKDMGIEFINVNLSPVQCMNSNLVEEFAEISKKHGIPMSMFDFEITESMVEDYDMIYSQMMGLQETGAVLSLDDFGTGASNLTSLMKLPIHVVKIDLSFVRSFFAGKADFLPDLITMFRREELKIVAEGIETQEMKDKLTELGCEYLQGYYFSKPLPPADFVSYMNQENN